MNGNNHIVDDYLNCIDPDANDRVLASVLDRDAVSHFVVLNRGIAINACRSVDTWFEWFTRCLVKERSLLPEQLTVSLPVWLIGPRQVSFASRQKMHIELIDAGDRGHRRQVILLSSLDSVFDVTLFVASSDIAESGLEQVVASQFKEFTIE